MLGVLQNQGNLLGFTSEQLQAAFFAAKKTSAERVEALAEVLRGPAARGLREQVGHWVLQHMRIEEIVPERYAQWRPLVQDAMLFWFIHLSTDRLAPKLVEQMELPAKTPTGKRLLKLIAKVPGLQKLGQVLARNRNLQPALRRALTELENGICDMEAGQVRKIITEELSSRLQTQGVRLSPRIFCEASVSAVMRFTWQNPESGKRERGVFKVMKPYIPAYFAEDMDLLAQLARYVAGKHREYGFARRVLPETFNDVRRLLQHEVEFTHEQATLKEAYRLYGPVLGIRVPRLFESLCTSKVTAMTEERGEKITTAGVHVPKWRRSMLSEILVEAFLAVPIFSPEKDAMFHADPHAGNLLYDKTSGELVILDWALTERVSREERRRLAMLFLMTALRDPDGICEQIGALSRGGSHRKRSQVKLIRDSVNHFISELPLAHIPGAADALDLLEEIAFKGVRLPAPLIMLRKVLFTLDGVQHDIGDPEVSVVSVLTRHATPRWLSSWTSFGGPLSLRDWLAVQRSALLFGGRVGWQGAQSWMSRPRVVPTRA